MRPLNMQSHGRMRGEEFGGFWENSLSRISPKLECRCMAGAFHTHTEAPQREHSVPSVRTQTNPQVVTEWGFFFFFFHINANDLSLWTVRICLRFFLAECCCVLKGRILLTLHVLQKVYFFFFIYNAAGPTKLMETNDLLKCSKTW